MDTEICSAKLAVFWRYCKSIFPLGYYEDLAGHTACSVSGGHRGHFYLDSETTAQYYELFLTAPSRNILTCLLAYLLTGFLIGLTVNGVLTQCCSFGYTVRGEVRKVRNRITVRVRPVV